MEKLKKVVEVRKTCEGEREERNKEGDALQRRTIGDANPVTYSLAPRSLSPVVCYASHTLFDSIWQLQFGIAFFVVDFGSSCDASRAPKVRRLARETMSVSNGAQLSPSEHITHSCGLVFLLRSLRQLGLLFFLVKGGRIDLFDHVNRPLRWRFVFVLFLPPL